jgi:hypothetical protein
VTVAVEVPAWDTPSIFGVEVLDTVRTKARVGSTRASRILSFPGGRDGLIYGQRSSFAAAILISSIYGK